MRTMLSMARSICNPSGLARHGWRAGVTLRAAMRPDAGTSMDWRQKVYASEDDDEAFLKLSEEEVGA